MPLVLAEIKYVPMNKYEYTYMYMYTCPGDSKFRGLLDSFVQ